MVLAQKQPHRTVKKTGTRINSQYIYLISFNGIPLCIIRRQPLQQMMARELNFHVWKKEIKSLSVANHTLHFLEPLLFYLHHYHHHTDHTFGCMCLLKNACGYYSKTLHSKYQIILKQNILVFQITDNPNLLSFNLHPKRKVTDDTKLKQKQ